ncbi:MAG: peptide-methionine (S)-S-oxide reductase MsrA [Hyphomonadaceae bacterium]|nr:peptide-methionine (S)-S-oxide reductase MsrA [Hyphomonadaceae bacterium]
MATAIAALAALASVAVTSAGAQGQSVPVQTVDNAEIAIFAGGCFWCVEADFDKVDGVLETISGYTGGSSENPTYRNHSEDGHIEAVQITYDPDVVSYEELVDYYFHHIDPVDMGGQFCDRGHSYTTAIFAVNGEQADIARSEISAIDASGMLPSSVVTKVRIAGAFYPAEEYHQDYYLKAPLKYNFYRQACGRDNRIEELWGVKASG